jgi:hypothetical protein
VGVASSDSPQSVVIQNSGNAALTTVSPGLSLSTNFTQVASFPSGFLYDSSSTCSLLNAALLPGASCTLGIDFKPVAVGLNSGAVVLTDNNLNVSGATQSIQVSGIGSQATPTITTPPTASSIAAGQALSASTLTGGVASTAGTFAWTNGTTILNAGTQTASVTFTPTSTNYTTVTLNVSIRVNQATTSITTQPTASAISYGQPLSASTLTGGAASTPGTFAWTTGTTVPNAGTQAASVTFTPTNTNYTNVTLNVSITVNQATPTITTAPSASSIPYGQALSNSTLTGGAASTPGVFAWTNSSSIPNAGTQTASVTFTPTSTNYTIVTLNVPITVNPAAPTITTAPSASSITYGQALSASTLTGGAASTSGMFAWTTPGTMLNAGPQTASVTFTPSSNNYTTVTLMVSITVNPATPTITTAPSASSITYGQALSNSTLTGGAASTSGMFAWTSPTTIPNSGSQTASVTFTPSSSNYRAVTTSIPVTVLLAQTITFNPIPGQVVGSMLTVSASASSGLPVSFTIVQNGNCSLSGSTLTFLNTGNCGVVATQAGNSTYAAAPAVGQSIVVSAPSVTLGISSTTQTYQAWTNFVIGPVYSGSRVPTGSVTLYLNGSALVTLTLGGDGKAYYTASPFNVGANVLYATYSGDSHFPAGLSAPINITVLPAPVNFQASCFGALVYGSAYQCTVNVSASTTIQPSGVITYSLDGAAATTVTLVNGNAAFTVPTLPAAGSHTLVLHYAAQGNYAAGAPITKTFSTAQGATLLLISPSSAVLATGAALSISGTASTPTSGVPSGSVTLYDNGVFSYRVASIARGVHSYYARYPGSTDYAAVNSLPVVVTAY